ncbi:hypothetical protein AVEN_266118-1, partial [Araneus ventricosus]
MPPKRQNIGSRTNAAKRKREERQNETEEEAAQRNEGNRLHMSQSHDTKMSALIKFSNLAFCKDGLALFCYFDLINLNRGEILGIFVHLLLIKMLPKRQNIGSRTNEAKRKREEKQNETEEETAQRNEG